mmetsp:Transcript_34511/g.86697  ORF Transcript_34511/g.86697 Transcript_34511/m.86697 type:complete len:311 (-) Transcript_34511:548-1480(-)
MVGWVGAPLHALLRVCVLVCVRAEVLERAGESACVPRPLACVQMGGVRACEHACVRECVRACVRACTRARYRKPLMRRVLDSGTSNASSCSSPASSIAAAWNVPAIACAPVRCRLATPTARSRRLRRFGSPERSRPAFLGAVCDGMWMGSDVARMVTGAGTSSTSSSVESAVVSPSPSSSENAASTAMASSSTLTSCASSSNGNNVVDVSSPFFRERAIFSSRSLADTCPNAAGSVGSVWAPVTLTLTGRGSVTTAESLRAVAAGGAAGSATLTLFCFDRDTHTASGRWASAVCAAITTHSLCHNTLRST